MLFEAFRFSIHSRLHGATGGFVIKGGSYRKGRAEIMPGRREEMPFFLEKGEFFSSDLGFRIVLSAIVTPHNRSTMLKHDWAEFSEQNRLFEQSVISQKNTTVLDQSKDIIKELEHLAESANNSAEKQTFKSIANFVNNFRDIYEKKESDAIDALIWRALFAEEYIVKYKSQHTQLQKELKVLKSLSTQTIPETEVGSITINISKLSEKFMISEANIDYLANSYINIIKDSQQFPLYVIDRQMDQIIMDQNLEGDLQSQLIAKLEVYRKHIELYSAKPENIMQSRIIDDIISAVSH